MSPDFTNPNNLVKSLRTDISLMIEDYLREMQSQMVGNDGSNLLNVLGAMQAILQEYYKQGLGGKETAMLYYGIADRMIADMHSKNQLPPIKLRRKK